MKYLLICLFFSLSAFGDAPLIFLFGHSSTGKSTLSRSLRNNGWVHLEKDRISDDILLEVIRTQLGLYDQEIRKSYGNEEIIHYLKCNHLPSARTSQEQSSLYALQTMRDVLKRIFSLEQEFLETIKELGKRAESHQHNNKPVVYDSVFNVSNMKKYLPYLSVKNKEPIVVLVYSSLEAMLERVKKRNQAHPLEWRSPLRILMQFSRFHQVKTDPQEPDLYHLSREEMLGFINKIINEERLYRTIRERQQFDLKDIEIKEEIFKNLKWEKGDFYVTLTTKLDSQDYDMILKSDNMEEVQGFLETLMEWQQESRTLKDIS